MRISVFGGLTTIILVTGGGLVFALFLQKPPRSGRGAPASTTEHGTTATISSSLPQAPPTSSAALLRFALPSKVPVFTMPPDEHASERRGVIQGTVTDPDGEPWKGVKVQAWRKDDVSPKAVRAVYSNDEGSFTIRGLAAGEYDLEATSAGLSTWRQQNVLLGPGVTLNVYPVVESDGAANEVDVVSLDFVAFEAEFVDRLPVGNEPETDERADAAHGPGWNALPDR